jgi:hypothetical protein
MKILRKYRRPYSYFNDYRSKVKGGALMGFVYVIVAIFAFLIYVILQ